MPVFDAWEVCLDASVNFENINDLFPRFEGDIPSGLCIAVGHSLMSYGGKKSDNTEGDAQVHLRTNIFFPIIFGILYIECHCSHSPTISIRFYLSKVCMSRRSFFTQFYIEGIEMVNFHLLILFVSITFEQMTVNTVMMSFYCLFSVCIDSYSDLPVPHKKNPSKSHL